MLCQVRSRGRLRRPQSPIAAWIIVVVLLAFSAFCGWYSQQSLSLSYEDEGLSSSEFHNVQKQLFAKKSAQAVGSEASPTHAMLNSIPQYTEISFPKNASNDTERLLIKNLHKTNDSRLLPQSQSPSPSLQMNFKSISKSLPPKPHSDSIDKLWTPVQTLAELNAFECVAWRQTAKCSPRGDQQPKLDGSCDRIILPTDSGFCEYRHQTTGEIRRIVAAKCKSRASQMGYSCRNATMLVRYNLMADDYKPNYPLSFENNQRDFIQENRLVQGNASSTSVSNVKPPASFSRGIVYVVYEQLLLSVYAAIRALRSTGCTLPIELWYRQDETNAFHPLLQELQLHYGAYLRVIKDARAKKFYTKLYAVFYTAFDHVLLLDADNFAAQDPTHLFTTEVYNNTGAIFWPDYWMPNRTIFKTKKNSDVWEFMGVPFVDMFEQESGQVLVNRVKHTKALHTLLHYGLTEPHFPAKFNMLWGDKDLFRFAWMRTNSSFHMIKRPPGSLGLKASHLNIFCGNTMVQHNPDGDIVFLHRNIVKFLPNKDNRQKLWEYVQQYHMNQDLRYYEVRGDVDHRWFPTIRKCYGRRINYLRANSLKPIQDFPFAGLENDIIHYVLQGEKLIKQHGLRTMQTKNSAKNPILK